jgi:site-specific recombinase XerD
MNDLTTLETAVRGFEREARSANTLRAYGADMRVFAAWCQVRGIDPLRPAPNLVAAFLADSVERSSVATISRRVAAIVHFCRAAGLPDPIDRHVRDVLAGIRRMRGTAPEHAKAALTVEQLRAMVDLCSSTSSADIRDKAILLLGFAGAFRRSELAALDVEHIERVFGGLLIQVPRSKTDQEGKGQHVAIVEARDKRYCPVLATEALMDLIGTGALFRDQIYQRRLTDRSIAEIVKSRARKAGVDPATISGHSLRAGFVTAASLAGANILKVAEHTRHKNLQSVKRYFRGDLFEDHAGKDLL